MREINYIVVHCTASISTATVDAIRREWKELGWQLPGYHYIIDRKGIVTQLADCSQVVNGVFGNNQNSIHVAYIGGQYTDDRTIQQRGALIYTLKSLLRAFPTATIVGHRDLSNSKVCPQFNAVEEYRYLADEILFEE